MVRLAIFASGQGSNARNVLQYFIAHPIVKVVGIACTKADSPLFGDPETQTLTRLWSPDAAVHARHWLQLLKDWEATHIFLAGYLKLVPAEVIAAYRGRIYNVHPSLLPAFGGKGMYGRKVHEAVKAAGAERTGITLHLVDEVYDNGAIVCQASTDLSTLDTVSDIEQKIKSLEQFYVPRILEYELTKKNT